MATEVKDTEPTRKIAQQTGGWQRGLMKQKCQGSPAEWGARKTSRAQDIELNLKTDKMLERKERQAS
jgi:hypothetical protein